MWLHRRAAHLLLLLLPVLGGLLPSRGEAAGGTVPGLPCATPRLVKDLASGAAGSNPINLVDVSGTLYFTTSEGPDGPVLWKSNGTAAGTQRVTPVGLWSSGATLSHLTAVGDSLFFMVRSSDFTLWWSDGTTTQPRMSFSLETGDILKLVAMNGKVYFAAKDGQDDNAGRHGFELWVSEDGPTGATRLVWDISPMGDSRPDNLTVFNGRLFFQADDGASGTELWLFDEAEPDVDRQVRLVEDLWDGVENGGPTALTVMGDWLYFFATDGTFNSSLKLWKTNGTRTEVVPSVVSESIYSGHADLTAVGSTLFFTLSDAAHGTELWVSDGTLVGTRRVKDIAPGNFSSSPADLTAVGGTLFFRAADANGRPGLWRSDGTEAGTFRVRNFLPEVPSPDLSKLTPGAGVLLVPVNDRVWGGELWKVDGTGAYRLTDLVPGSGSSSPSEVTISGGKLFFVATQPGVGEELFVIPLNEVDCFAPSLYCPGDQLLEAASPEGTRFTSPPAVAFDDSLTGLSLSYSPALPSQFPLGETTITATVRDLAGNNTTCDFTVEVVDTTPPLLLCPTAVRQEATSLDGATVSYSVGVSDAVTAQPDVDYHGHPPGSAFVRGETSVTVTATDRVASPASCTFPVIVQDTRAPRLTCPEDMVRIATSAEPISVSYTVSAEDALPITSLIHDPPLEARFPVGRTPVTIAATDAADNTSRCTFVVDHVDPVGPTITCPGPQQGVATEEAGARVDFPAATAEDNLAPPLVSYSHEPGSTFAVGETIVTAEARDLGGNTASCTFPVTVVEESGSGCGCGAGSSGGGLWWLLLALAPVWSRRRAARLER